jgi:carbon-monoxide dehydrogenase large subunit
MSSYSTNFVTGKASYVADLKLPGMLTLHIIRSTHARAKLVGVKGGITSAELDATLGSAGEGARGGSTGVVMPVLAKEYVNFVGQPVAAIIAQDAYQAEDLAEAVEIEYEPLKALIDTDESLVSPPIHPGTDSNILSDSYLGKEFDIDAQIILEDYFTNERIAANPIETRGVVAHFDGSVLTLWASTQSVFSVKHGVCAALGLSPESVRVIQADTGGAFGSKGGVYPEYVIAAYASMKTRHPVRWTESRTEHLISSNHGRGSKASVKIFANRDGTVVGLKADVITDAGAYFTGLNAFAPGFIGLQVTGPYAIRNAHVRARSVYTNKVPLGPYRGAGRPEAAFFIERMMDLLADELGMDPVDVRIKNTVDGLFVSPTGLRVENANSFLKKAAGSLGYSSALRATGFSFFVLFPAVMPGESAKISVGSGRVRVWLGGNTHGQDHEAFVKRLVSEELNVAQELVTLERGDTSRLSRGVGSWGSRSAMVGGAAVMEAARKLRDMAKEHVGETGGDNEYSPENLLRGEFEVEVFVDMNEQLNTLGANLARVTADEEGRVRILELKGYYDVGRALNPEMVVSQIIGGSAQGVGQVLYERVVYSGDGQPLILNLADAGVPNALDVPDIDARYTEIPSKLPHGAKGVGESPTIGVPAALARAIEKASGKRVRRTPVAIEDLFQPSGAHA